MKSKKIKDILAIKHSPVGIIEKKDFARYIELPCLEACIYLYDMNIHTFSSGCNMESPDNAHIMVEYKYLSEENKEIANQLIQEGLAQKTIYNDEEYLAIVVKTTIDDIVDDVSNRLLNIVKRFNYQDVLYGFMSKEEYLKSNIELTKEFLYRNGEIIPLSTDGTKEEIEDRKNNALFDACEAYEEAVDEGRVDFDNDIIWDNKELFDKHIEYLLSVKEMVKK